MGGGAARRPESEVIARAPALLAALLWAVAGCAGGDPDGPPPGSAAVAGTRPPVSGDEAGTLAGALRAIPVHAAPGAVVVRLAFGSEADLDLYVTGPLEETVYFANSPSRVGGRLLDDLRCDAGSPRIETIVFADAPPGRYRVGVDFPERCDGGRGDAAFVVEVLADGRHELRAGRIGLRVFEPKVLEFTPGSAPPGPAP